MKKTAIIIGLIIAFLIIYFIQANFFVWFTIAGIKPNLFIIFVLFISLFLGIKQGISFGLGIGIFIDLVLGRNLGTYAIMLTCVAILGGIFDKNFSKDSKFTIMLMVMATTIAFEVGSYTISVLILNMSVEVLEFIKILAIETIFNAIITIILYPIMNKFGYKMEDEFKQQKMLTKYF